MAAPIKITECPRDAMQGIRNFIPTELKAAYINLLLQIGFDVIDFGSFVSAKTVPQMRDTSEVLRKLDLSQSRSQLLAIVANYRGALEACHYPEISYLGYPFSISETFQQRNTNSGIAAAFETVKAMLDLCAKNNKILRIYLSMGFGNPYGDEWSLNILKDWTDKLIKAGARDIYIADTTGVAAATQISAVLNALQSFGMPFGLHLHSAPSTWQQKVKAAYQSGCRSFDCALGGYGGCPMAADELTGNIASEDIIGYLLSHNEPLHIDLARLKEALIFSRTIFSPSYSA